MMNKFAITSAFKSQFNIEPQVTVRSPGRINLIGEHTDYNDGFVLPAAIDKAIWVSLSLSPDEKIHLFSVDKNELVTVSATELVNTAEGWPDYILGVVDELRKLGFTVPAFNIAVSGNVPQGAGLSSSAALECATVFALNELLGLALEKVPMVQLAQRAENNFVGMKCGIMDQFASMMGKKGEVLRIDCRSLEYAYFPLNIEGYKVLLLDTGVKHALVDSEYNTRREQCEEGVRLIQQKYPAVQKLRDASVEMVEELITDPIVKNRCRYVVEEIQRLLTAGKLLEKSEWAAFGEQMFLTHDGLSKLYEVSCPQADFLVDEVRNNPAVLGARMMGGGFGGCTINLVKEAAIDELVSSLAPAYEEKFGIPLKYYIASIEDGTTLL